MLLRGRVFQVALLLALAFFPIAYFVPATKLYFMMGSVLLTTSITAVWQYWPVVKNALKVRLRSVDRVEVLTFGIILLFAGTAFREAYITFWREFLPLGLRRPDEYFYPLAFIRYTCIIASVLALCAKDMIIGPVGKRRMPGWPVAILSVAIGIAIGTFMIYWLL